MEDEQVQIVSVTLEDILRTSLPTPADHLPWYIPKRFWHWLVATNQIPSCESVSLEDTNDTGRQDSSEHCPAQPTRDILLRCSVALVRLHNIRHIVVASRNGGTVKRLLQLTSNSRTFHLVVLTDRISTVVELLSSGTGNLTIIRYGRAALVGDGELSKLPASYNIGSDEDIIDGIGGLKVSPEKWYEVKLEKLFQSTRLILEQREHGCLSWAEDARKVLFLHRSFVHSPFVNCFKIKRLR
uniref:Uncharacterized protein n=1 Tax=Anopheles atroparvus TaxID=41427 RepID=A0A182IKE4_ANOAO